MHNSLLNFFENKLNEYIELIKQQTGRGYDLSIFSKIDYRPNNSDGIIVNMLFGPENKIVGSNKTFYQNFNMTIWAELNTDGSFTEKIFEYLFDEYSKQYITLIIDDEEYNIFLDFGNLILLDSKVESGNSFRVKFSMNGNLIYSSQAIIGRHTYISLEGLPYEEIKMINPQENRQNNLKNNNTKNGIKLIDDNPVFSGNLGIILENSSTHLTLLMYLHKQTHIDFFNLKFEYGSLSIEEKKLKINSISSSFDENTKNTILTISYVKED